MSKCASPTVAPSGVHCIIAGSRPSSFPRQTEGVAWFVTYKIAEYAMAAVIETDPELVALSARMRQIERAHGREEDDPFSLTEAPPEWLAVEREWNVVFAERFAALLRSVGEDEMALRSDDIDIDPRFTAGRVALYGGIGDEAGE